MTTAETQTALTETLAGMAKSERDGVLTSFNDQGTPFVAFAGNRHPSGPWSIAFPDQHGMFPGEPAVWTATKSGIERGHTGGPRIERPFAGAPRLHLRPGDQIKLNGDYGHPIVDSRNTKAKKDEWLTWRTDTPQSGTIGAWLAIPKLLEPLIEGCDIWVDRRDMVNVDGSWQFQTAYLTTGGSFDATEVLAVIDTGGIPDHAMGQAPAAKPLSKTKLRHLLAESGENVEVYEASDPGFCWIYDRSGILRIPTEQASELFSDIPGRYNVTKSKVALLSSSPPGADLERTISDMIIPDMIPIPVAEFGSFDYRYNLMGPGLVVAIHDTPGEPFWACQARYLADLPPGSTVWVQDNDLKADRGELGTQINSSGIVTAPGVTEPSAESAIAMIAGQEIQSEGNPTRRPGSAILAKVDLAAGLPTGRAADAAAREQDPQRVAGGTRAGGSVSL